MVALFLNLYVFSIIGMGVFGNVVNQSNPALKGTDFDILGYYDCCTFRTWIDSMIAAFHLMVANNWIVTAKAHVVATSEWAIVFFIVFYFLTIVILLSLMVAVIVETFLFKLRQVEATEKRILKNEGKSDDELRSGSHDSVSSPWQVKKPFHFEMNATQFVQHVYRDEKEAVELEENIRKREMPYSPKLPTPTVKESAESVEMKILQQSIAANVARAIVVETPQEENSM